MFKGKNVLFFSASFFGYQFEVRDKLTSFGARVDFFDERPKNTFWYKALIRFDKRILIKQIERYYQGIIDTASETEYDYIFFLKAEVISYKMLKELRHRQPAAKCILYMWDSIENCPSVQKLFPLFDKVLSFDRKDVLANSFMTFRPLFYLDDYARIAKEPAKTKYDVSFIGTGHTDRYPIVRKIRQASDQMGLKGYFFLYLQDIRIYYLRKLFSPAFKYARQNEFSFKPLGKDEILKILRDSRCVLDIERPVQCGLTMRSIEVLGAKRKLITTNKDIVHYDFYNESNICIIDRDNPVLPEEFLRSAYVEVKSRVYEKYSIGFWLQDIFHQIEA
jgi:hypothetical protein